MIEVVAPPLEARGPQSRWARAFTRIDAGDVPDAKTILKHAGDHRGEDGIHRWVGLGVIANNLVSTATFSNARASA